MWFKRHFFSLTLIILFTLTVSASFFRFFFLNDYTVTYEAECTEGTDGCFHYCLDDNCQEIFYYHYITRNASTLKSLCGPDITNCDGASACLPDEEMCFETYCSGDECEGDYGEGEITDPNNASEMII